LKKSEVLSSWQGPIYGSTPHLIERIEECTKEFRKDGRHPGPDSIPNFPNMKQEVLGRTNRLVSLILHGPRRKGRVQQFFYCRPCIRYCGKVFTEPLPSNDKGVLPSRFLATIGGFLPSRCLATIGEYTYRHTDCWEGFFN
jgi:hypothetical protein